MPFKCVNLQATLAFWVQEDSRACWHFLLFTKIVPPQFPHGVMYMIAPRRLPHPCHPPFRKSLPAFMTFSFAL